MKKIFTILILLFANFLIAQTHAITDTGDEVILNDNGTWNYINDSIPKVIQLKLNDKVFTKNDLSSFLVKSKKLNIGIWINPKKWSFNKALKKEATEFIFSKKENDLYAILITEKIQIPLETLRNIALVNAKNASADIKVLKEEYRMVNGKKVLMMQMVGTIQGLRFKYMGYYYSNPNGTVQFLSYTFESQFDEFEHELELFLNGLTEY